MSNLFPKSAAALSNKGLRRKENEDMALLCGKFIREESLLIRECPAEYPFIVAIADGMGGHAGGKVASEATLRRLQEKIDGSPKGFWEEESEVPPKLTDLVSSLHAEINEQSSANTELAEMGTTLSGILVTSPGKVFLFHVGDTRIYRFRQGELHLLTRDHSMQGQGPSFTANALVNAIGGGVERFYVDVEQIDDALQEGDLLMLSTDGLHDKVEEEEISKQLALQDSLEAKSANLLQMALEAGGYDNVTIVLLAF